MPAAISVSVRCWRQVTQITTPPPAARASARGGRAVVAEVREHDLLEVDLVQLPAGVVDVAVGAHEQRGLALGVALADHVVDARDRRRIGARPGQQAMARDDLVDRRRRAARCRGREDHEVIADPLEVGDDVRREHDGHARLGDRLHHRSAGTRGGRADRATATGSSSTSSSGRLASASVSATCACWPPESVPTFWLERQPERSMRSQRERVVPARVELAAERQHLRDAEALVERVLLRDEADAREQRGGIAPRREAEHADVSRGRPASGPIASCSSVVLPAPFGPTSAVTEPAGISSVQSRSAQCAP